jgi:hypothetical protein
VPVGSSAVITLSLVRTNLRALRKIAPSPDLCESDA